MSLKLPNCKAILSEDARMLTLNVKDEDGVSVSAYPIPLAESVEPELLKAYFERHGEEVEIHD